MVRTVNWVIKDALSYEIRGGDTAWKSRLLLLELDRDLRVISSAGVDPPEDLPQLKYHIDIGFADPRPFGWRGEVWFVSTFRQLNTQGLSEIVISRVSRARPNGYVMCDWHVVPSGMQPQHEKNWMPQVVGDELRLIDPTRVLTDSGAIVHNEPAAIAAENFRGGSQAVPFDEGWLAIIHEVEHVNRQRRYCHRFIWMDSGNTLRRLSRRFYLKKLGVEFVAGMAWHRRSQNAPRRIPRPPPAKG